jgi:hypothetical protein
MMQKVVETHNFRKQNETFIRAIGINCCKIGGIPHILNPATNFLVSMLVSQRSKNWQEPLPFASYIPAFRYIGFTGKQNMLYGIKPAVAKKRNIFPGYKLPFLR